MPKKKTPIDTNAAGRCRNTSGEQSDGTVINIVNCQGVQVGPSNTLTLTGADGATGPVPGAKDSVNFTAGQGASSSLSRNDVGILVVRNILKSRGESALYDDLNGAIKETLKDEKAKSFMELSGLTLQDFLIRNKDVFDVNNRRGKRIVRLHNQKSRKSKQSKTVDNDHTNSSSMEERSLCDSNAVDDSSKIPDFSDEESEKVRTADHKTWTEVKRKHKAPKQHLECIKTENAPEECTQGDSFWTFKSLLNKQENTDLLFISGHDVYTNSNVQFLQDVVSMWNTPQRLRSHIIIGVRSEPTLPHSLIGCQESTKESFYKNLLEETDIFTMRPLCNFFEITYDSKLFLMIEIACSSGQGSPSIVRREVQEQDIVMHENELWYRRGKSNAVCPAKDFTNASIYQWFLGSAPSPECTHTPTALKSEKDDENVEAQPSNRVDDNVKINPSKIKNFTQFWKSVHGFKKGHFVLLAGDVPNEIPNLAGFSLAPWIAVYDFDIFGHTKGLFNALQDSLGIKRHLRVGTWKEQVQTISEHGTWWCFMRGRREMHDTRTDSDDGSIEDQRTWFKQVKRQVSDICDQISSFCDDYTAPTVVFLWPQREELLPIMTKFLEQLIDTLSYTPNIVICMHKPPVTEKANNRLKTLRDDYNDVIQICEIDFEHLCLGISNHTADEKKCGMTYKLPRAEDYLSQSISDKEATWLKEDLEVLYLDNPYTKGVNNAEEIEDEINDFYKGGNLHWCVWYNKGDKNVDIDRDVLKPLEEQVKPHLESFKTAIVTLFHDPGSGGSTLAKRLLWMFHTRFPCIQAKSGAVGRSRDLGEKVSFIYEKTQLPVLMLIDGEEEPKVKYLSNVLNYTTIVYVKRYPYKVFNHFQKDKVFLKGTVSSNEAQKLALKFGERCNMQKKRALQNLSDGVQKGYTHNLFEFGMTVYLHEFKGLGKYVKGYLQLDNNPTKDLLPWQQCLGYLALVYYYGQTSIPCQFFAALFHKPPNYAMSLEEDFPYPVPEFAVYGTDDRKGNNLRICHYAVAKEILEQILSRHSKSEDIRTYKLSINARRNLADFCKDFIEYASKRKMKAGIPSTTIRYILTRTFIFRDEKDMGDNEEQARRKPVLSKVMIDIPAGKPLFTERLQILEKISSSFPDDPNFHAHVGRFHAFCRPDGEQKAEECFKVALHLCNEATKGKEESELDNAMRSTLMHIYHLYGIVKHRSLSQYTGRSPSDKITLVQNKEMFNMRMRELIDIAEISCLYFTKSREITPKTQEVYAYAYTGEIQVRLQICDYVKRHFTKESTQDTAISDFLTSSDIDERSKTFVKTSICIIENLITDCYTDVELIADDLASVKRHVRWYNDLFKRQVLPELPSEDDALISRRIQIAEAKLKFGSSTSLGGIEMVDSGKGISKIVHMYEEIFDDVQRYGFEGSYTKKMLDRDFREWIVAIRHEKLTKVYSLEDVLLRVQFWYDMVRSPMSAYYSFIIRSLLGFGTETNPGRSDCLMDALSMKDELETLKRLILRPRYPREWLGSSGDGIKILVPAGKQIGLSPEDRDSANSMSQLAVCKGTIRHPNTNKIGGFLSYDLGVSTVDVLFIPKRASLEGQRHVGQRVEFNLAFSIDRGYEAFNVKVITRHGCPSCSTNVEFTSLDSTLPCLTCGELVHKDPINEIQQESD